jgi:HK97 family phage major capsid protein
MKSIQALREERQALLAKARKLMDDHPGASWQVPQQKQYDEILAGVERLDREIAGIEKMLDTVAQQAFGRSAAGRGPEWRDAQGNIVRVLRRDESFSNGGGLYGREPGARFGLGSFVRAMVLGTDRPEIKASLSEGTDSAGGFTVPIDLLGQLIDRMRAKAVCVQAGALTVPLETQKTSIARLASDPAVAWRAENAAAAESDPTFEKVEFTARSLACLVKCSRELLEDSVNIEDAVLNAFAQSMALELDRVGLFGTGVAPQPRGVFNTTNVGEVSMGANGAQLTNYAKLLDALYELDIDNAAEPTAQIMHPRTSRVIDGFADTTGQPLNPPKRLADLPRLVTTTAPINQVQGTAVNASSIIVGDFSQMMLGVRTQLRIEVLRERYAENLQYAFLAHLRADIQLAHPESFCKLVGIIP